MRKVPGLEALQRDYGPKGVKFYYVYKALAHPELHGYVTPYTLQERLAHVREARRRLRTQIPWIVDAMDNRIKHAFGDRPNSEFLIDPEGIVLVKRAWSNPQALRADLERIVGPVAQRTDPDELELGRLPGRSEARPAELPRLELPAALVPVRVRPHLATSTEPFYAKLRVEAERSVLRTGSGKLYFGLRLDPLYGVHWNNLVGPVKVSIDAADRIRVSKTALVAPRPEQDSDTAPREFLLDVTDAQRGATLRVTVHYAACHGKEGWCKILAQQFTIILERDPDAGRVLRGRARRPVRSERATDGDQAARRSGPLLRGTVVQVGSGQLLLRTADGDTIKLRLLPGSYAVQRGKRVALQTVRSGQRVAVRTIATGATPAVRYVLLLPSEP